MYIWYTYIIYICVFYIYIDIIQACYSGILFDVPFWHSFWYLFWHPIWHPFWHLFRQFFSSILIGILSDILSSIYSDILSGIYSDITFWHSILTFFLTWAPDLIGHRPLRSDLRSWGSAVPTEIWSWNEEGGQRKEERKKEGRKQLWKNLGPYLAGRQKKCQEHKDHKISHRPEMKNKKTEKLSFRNMRIYMIAPIIICKGVPYFDMTWT